MRLQLAHFQTKKVEESPSSKYVIPNFKKPPPLQELASVSSSLPVQKRWPYQPFLPFTISLFKGGLVVWTPDGPNIPFWESKEKLKLPWEEVQPIEEDKEVEVEQKEDDPILLFEELLSFVEEEEERKVVPILEERVLVVEP